ESGTVIGITNIPPVIKSNILFNRKKRVLDIADNASFWNCVKHIRLCHLRRRVKSFFWKNCSHCSLGIFVVYFHNVSE
ncbi:hypothetical protein, partial [Klebsiella variicola]|uniref:hypothetical protein n=1 Tax=Klebsiella variicola TaxID=244366 RepID=UPI0019517DCD